MVVVVGIELNVYSVELFDNAADGEGCEIFQSTASV